MATRKKKLTHPLPEAGHSRWCLQNLWSFYFTSLSPLPLYAIKETGIQTLIRWLFWDFSLPSSQSAGFPNKVVFFASTPCLRFVGLSCSEQTELGLGNIYTEQWLWILESWLHGTVNHHSWETNIQLFLPYFICIYKIGWMVSAHVHRILERVKEKLFSYNQTRSF